MYYTDFINVIFGLLGGILISYIFYRLSKKYKRINYFTEAINVISENATKESNVEVLFKKNHVNYLTVTKVTILNTGNESIDYSDNADLDKLAIIIPNNKIFYDVQLVATTSDTNNFRIRYPEEGETLQIIYIDFDYIDKNEGCVVKIVHSDKNSNNIIVTGTFKNMVGKKIKEAKMTKVSLLRRIREPLSYIIISIIAIIYYLITLRDNGDYVTLFIFIVVLIISVILSIVQGRQRKLPDALDVDKIENRTHEEVVEVLAREENGIELKYEETSDINLKENDEALINTKTVDELYDELLKRPVEDSAEEIREDVNESINEEIENQMQGSKEHTHPFSTLEILAVLNKYNFPHIHKYPTANDLDFKFYYWGKDYYLMIKPLLISKIGLVTINTLKSYLTNRSGEVWLVYNTGLTTLAIKEIASFNAINKDIKIIQTHVHSTNEFENILTARLNLKKI